VEYGAIYMGPIHNNRNQQIREHTRRGARFITKNYRSREDGCLTKMLKDLDHHDVNTRGFILLQSG
jgi:hypothetical protein